MNKLTKLMLASAMMITSGFAATTYDVVVENSGEVEVEKYNDNITVSINVKDAGKISIEDDVKIDAGGSVILESGATGTIAEGKTLSNAGVIEITYDNEKAGMFAIGGGDILQLQTSEHASVIGNFDGNGTATRYVYEGKGDMFVEYPDGSTIGDDNKPLIMFAKTKDMESLGTDLNVWYVVNCDLGIYFYGNDLDESLTYAHSHGLKEMNNSCVSNVTFVEALKEKSVGNVIIGNLSSVIYAKSPVASIVSDSTDLSSGALNGKTAKILSTSGSAGFNPDIPNLVAPIKIADPDKSGEYLTFGNDMSKVSSKDSLEVYFDSFGVSFTRSDGTASTINYSDGKSRIDALKEGTASETVLIDNTAIAVGDAASVVTNMHNIGVTGGVSSFTGTGILTLSGINTLLSNATLDCPVKVAGVNSIPTNAMFKNTLEIAENAEIASGSEVELQGALSVVEDKSLKVTGKLTLKSAVSAE